MEIFLQIIFNAVFTGSVYFLFAIGFTLIYGILRVIHFTHVDIGITGVFFYIFLISHKIPVPFSIFFALCVSAILGVCIYYYGYKPLIRNDVPSLVPLIVSIGISIILQHILLLKFGDTSYQVYFTDRINLIEQFSGAYYKISYVIGFGIAIIVFIIAEYILNHTTFGRSMRALSEDKELASILGVRSTQIIIWTFAICSALSFFSAFFIGINTGIFAKSGILPTIKVFTISIVGGSGSVKGTFIVAMILAILERLVGVFLTSGMKDIVIFVVLVGFLMIRSKGVVKRL